ncbi:MAG: hypothetical protein NDJ90_07365 [Oligoflexia bacterium]|nr:hypothetical protein [Oligoflexia bacterium]
MRERGESRKAVSAGVLGILLGGLLGGLSASSALARPEYAAKEGIVNCAACHVSPFGAGIRNAYGKLFQTRKQGPAATSLNEVFQGDLRVIGYFPENAAAKTPADRAAGVALMSSIVAVNVPLRPETGTGEGARLVFGYDFGNLNRTIRDGYVLFRPRPVNERAWLSSVQFGRFQVIPFGLLTDEHRVFNRVLTKTEFHVVQELGLALGGDPNRGLHYDAGILPWGAGNAFADEGEGLNYSVLGNLRASPKGLPGFVGASYRKFVRWADRPVKPYAAAVYGALSGARLTDGAVKLTLLGEVTLARGFNDDTAIQNASITDFSGTNTAFLSAVRGSQSIGYLLEADYDLRERLTLQYRFERAALDRRYLADAFLRHGLGFRFAVNPATSFWSRYEVSISRRPGISAETSRAARDALLLVLHVSI